MCQGHELPRRLRRVAGVVVVHERDHQHPLPQDSDRLRVLGDLFSSVGDDVVQRRWPGDDGTRQGLPGRRVRPLRPRRGPGPRGGAGAAGGGAAVLGPGARGRLRRLVWRLHDGARPAHGPGGLPCRRGDGASPRPRRLRGTLLPDPSQLRFSGFHLVPRRVIHALGQPLRRHPQRLRQPEEGRHTEEAAAVLPMAQGAEGMPARRANSARDRPASPRNARRCPPKLMAPLGVNRQPVARSRHQAPRPLVPRGVRPANCVGGSHPTRLVEQTRNRQEAAKRLPRSRTGRPLF